MPRGIAFGYYAAIASLSEKISWSNGSKSLVTAVALTPVGSPPVRTAFQSRTVRLRQACAAFTTTRVSCLGYTTTRAMSPGDEPGVGLCVRRCAGSEGWTRMTPPSRCFASAANSSMDIRPSGRSSYQLRGEGSGGKELGGAGRGGRVRVWIRVIRGGGSTSGVERVREEECSEEGGRRQRHGEQKSSVCEQTRKGTGGGSNTARGEEA